MSEKISSSNKYAMSVCAILIDGSQFVFGLIPFVGFLIAPIIHVFATCLFVIWFSHIGVSLFSSRLVFRTLLTLVGEFIPIVNMFPIWTAFVGYVIVTTNKPDETA